MTKRCSTCKQDKFVSEFHKNKGAVDGFNNVCKLCIRELNASLRARRKAIPPEVAVTEKVCKGCGTLKPADAFAVDKARADGRLYRCKECQNSRYRKNHKAPVRLSQEEREHRDRLAKKQWREQNRELANELSKESKRKKRLALKTARTEAGVISGLTARWLLGPEAPGHKICRRCRKEKPTSGFRTKIGARMGISAICTKCEREIWVSGLRKYAPSAVLTCARTTEKIVKAFFIEPNCIRENIVQEIGMGTIHYKIGMPLRPRRAIVAFAA